MCVGVGQATQSPEMLGSGGTGQYQGGDRKVPNLVITGIKENISR